MAVVAIVAAVVLAIGLLGAATPKLRLHGTAWTALRDRGLSENQVRAIGGAELAGALGLLVGLFWGPLGLAAAVALLALLLGAIGFHVKHGDYGNPDMRGPALYPAGLAALAAVVVATLLAT
ncbi:hypothetical protein FK531_20145 [Rhodococcus spelaei]|uniref:DoxX family protein n=1 Tax=Rhodococcus spelaei TaxID=2546320 RepID=A0A541B0J5_9NOCA|nr:hypothetical protein FK531_20145 [Rhodococcus spelaei]